MSIYSQNLELNRSQKKKLLKVNHTNQISDKITCYPPVLPAVFYQSKNNLKIGILVVDCHGKIVSLNRIFIDLWSLPSQLLMSRNDDRALEYISKQFNDPKSFLEEVKVTYKLSKSVIYDTITLKDGKTFERYSSPQLLEEDIVGRLWKFRDASSYN